LLLRPRRYTAALAALVAGTGAAALIVYRCWNVRSFGPIPRMYEPVWFTEKTTAAVAEIAATFVALVLRAALPPRCDDDQPAQDEDHHRSRLARPV
jgi:hypothetical protein